MDKPLSTGDPGHSVTRPPGPRRWFDSLGWTSFAQITMRRLTNFISFSRR
ncbi:hypothetical protein BZL29_3884 [Mycobacterium kansasii]|uniref:Uncharacterized protein n=1 Tax=Mycobacterium kansasii TaxID=1768 RepID=A0A1V3XCK0_MYCKA|nr:hypothetical protein BZL29_3884 [Mycobacterium kansasii]